LSFTHTNNTALSNGPPAVIFTVETEQTKYERH
jgi:hypothetical protein